MKSMSEEEIRSTLHEFVTALTTGDAEKAATFCTEDVVWENPEGTFEGIDELKRYASWMTAAVADPSFSESGVGILVQGDQAAFEHRFAGTYEGQHVEWLALCTYELADGKIQRMRTTYDRLAILQQAASGWLEETLINSLVKRAEKGLH
jgi:ketosteroid isomerase-like protein